MADVKINDLTPAAEAVDAMQLETDIGGTTANKVTIAQIKAAAVAAVSGITGGAYYNGTDFTEAAPLVVNNSREQFLVNGSGSSTNKTQLPDGIADFWAANAITPENEGDRYILRIDFKAKMAAQNAYAILQVDIGNGSQINIVERTLTFPRGANTEHAFSVSFPVFVGSTFIANGAKLFFSTQTSGDNMSVYETAIDITRIHKAV